MIEDHEAIEELLAGYALRSLSDEDAERADLVLTEHVPECPMCRDTLADFQVVTANLSLTAPAAEPPDLLLARLRREISEEPAAVSARRRRDVRASERRWGAATIGLAASFVAIVAMGALSVSLGSRASRAEDQRGFLTRAFTDASAGGVTPNGLEGTGEAAAGTMVEISGPQLERMYLISTDCPLPAPGNVYRLWLGNQGSFELLGEFVPAEDGWVGLELTVDTTGADELAVTEEPAGSVPRTPSEEWRWGTQLG